MNPVCGNCEIEMRCGRNGVTVAPAHNPRYQRSGDKFYCPRCDSSVVVNFGSTFDTGQQPNLILQEV